MSARASNGTPTRSCLLIGHGCNASVAVQRIRFGRSSTIKIGDWGIDSYACRLEPFCSPSGLRLAIDLSLESLARDPALRRRCRPVPLQRGIGFKRLSEHGHPCLR
ncbi:unnamed protein product, partial [Prorocentrum cordatum]